MAEPALSPEVGLAEFDAAHSPSGLFDRYARGRIAHFAHRQILTIGGAISLAVLASPVHGLAAILIALLGEAIDCLTLRRIPHWRAAGRSLRWMQTVTTVTAGIQALTICACILIAEMGATSDEVSFFVLAFLAGAAMNAGLVLPFHPDAAIARLGIYALTCMAFLASRVLTNTGLPSSVGYDLLGAVMLLYMVKVFLEYIIHSQNRAQQERRELLLGSAALAVANSELHEKQREARQLSLVARHANDSVVISSPDQGILWVNDAFTRMTGYTLGEAVGQTAGALLNSPDTDPATVHGIVTAVAGGKPHRTEILNRTKSGKDIWVDTNLVPLLDTAGVPEVVIAIERNVTESRDNARQLAEAKLRAEDGARAKAAFLATMSHEIRTPMNGIIGMSEILSEANLTPEQRDHVATINDSAEALLKIINDILDFSKLDAKKLSIAQDPFSLSSCLRSASNLLRPQAREKALFLDICHDTALPEQVVGDTGRLRQVIINLVGNAIKFTEKGGVTVRVAVTQDGPTHHLVSISVEDTGVGVRPDRAEAIFEQFEQADAETTQKFGGTGLGLAISRQLARIMGGDLVLCPKKGNVKSTANGDHASTVGATFQLTVRVGRMTQTLPLPSEDDIQPLPVLDGLNLLVAEDNRTNRHLIKHYLAGQKIQLRFALNGREAVDMAVSLRPDIILMDMSMPVLDGLSAARQIRGTDMDQPHIIALTANAFASDRAACMAAGMNGFLSKPIRKAQLVQALGRARPA